MNRFFLSVAFIIIYFSSLLPEGPSVTFRGKVLSASDSTAVSNGTVVIYNLPVKTIAWTGIINASGEFACNLEEGKYLMEASYVGYKTLSDTIETGRPNRTFYLKESTTHLKDAKLPLKEARVSLACKTITESGHITSFDGVGATYDFAPGAVTKPALPRGRATFAPEERTVAPEERIAEISEVPLSRGGPQIPETLAGTLTAGEINDFSKWELWKDLRENEFLEYARKWSMFMKNRYCVQITNRDNRPVTDCRVLLLDAEGKEVFETRTDNTGKAELWAGMKDSANGGNEKYRVKIVSGEKVEWIGNPIPFAKGVNHKKLKEDCSSSNTLDIAFVVDATGSMADEINYLKTEMLDVINRVKAGNQALDMRLASVFYRDISDDYLVRKADFTTNAGDINAFINAQGADGGGDFPEAVDEALDAALSLNWSKNARARIMFLVLDAPPHEDPQTLERIARLTRKAAAMGIRLIPVASSGIDKSVEFLMRSLALATNGTYVFLTDHSGVGNPHIAPSTDKYDVEKLNDLMVRVINQYVFIPDCENNKWFTTDTTAQASIRDTSAANQGDTTIIPGLCISLKCFPNPAIENLVARVSHSGGELYIADISGKLIMRIEVKEMLDVPLNLSNYPPGTYFVKYLFKDKWVTEKIVLLG